MKDYRLLIFIVIFLSGCTNTFLEDEFLSENEQITTKSGSVLLVPEVYSTIQEAVDAASNKDVIMVSSGVYNEKISIQGFEELTILGDNSIINQVAAGSVINFSNCKNFEISGFEINGPDKTFPSLGITVKNSSGEISDCNVNGFWHGIYGTNEPGISSDLIIAGCNIKEFEKYGIVTWKGVHSTIKKNSFLKTALTPNIGVITCISVWGGSPNIKLNKIDCHAVGITINDDAYTEDGQLISVNVTDAEIKSNDFFNCQTGIIITTLYGGEVLNTNIINNSFINVGTNYLIGVDENEVKILPK